MPIDCTRWLFSRLMFSYAYDFTPEVEIGSIDEGYFDLTGTRKPPVTIAETIRNAIRQSLKLPVSEGIASNKLVSQIASKLKKPQAFQFVPAGNESVFLSPLASKWLPGIGPKAAQQLNAAGLAFVVASMKWRQPDGQIVETVDRSDLYEAQTPQVFDANLLRRAYKNLDKYPPAKVSDDSFLVEALGQKVAVVKTDHSNIKITTPNDIPIAEAILHSRPKPKPEGPIGPYVEAQW